MNFLSHSLTPLIFLQAEQVKRVQGLISVKSKIDIAIAFPDSSYISGLYFGIDDNSGFDVPGGGGVARPESLEAMGTQLTTRPVLKLHSSVYA